jgi:hypothetical protein
MLEHWLEGLQIGFPNSMGIVCFQPWGQYKAIKVQQLLITWGRLKTFFKKLFQP